MSYRALISAAAAACLVSVSGCSVLYEIGQEEAARACKKEVMQADRMACERRFSKTYEQYEKERQAVRNPRSDTNTGGAANSLCFRRASTGELVCPNH